MKANVCFITYSFNFNSTEKEFTESLHLANDLVNKMSSDFIQFSISNDLINKFIEECYTLNKFIEVGALASIFYDRLMSKAKIIDLNSDELIEHTNIDPPEHENRYLSIYGNMIPGINETDKNKIIFTVQDLINYSKSIVIMNTYNAQGYADAFKNIYRNLVFHPNYNKIDQITSGCKNFIIGIFEMFDVMNSYTPKDGDPKEDISYLNTQIKFLTCEEGGSKKRRKTEDTKLDFSFDFKDSQSMYNCEYHCKLEYMDDQYKTGKYHNNNRMYFGFYKTNNPENINRILIAHLGGHL